MSVQLNKQSTQSHSSSPIFIQDGEHAIRRANGYLAKHVGIHFKAADPILVQLQESVWQVMISYKIPGLEAFRVGFLYINASTGDVETISDEDKKLWIAYANAYLESNASTAAIPQ